MKKYLLYILIFLNIGYFCFGQDGNRRNKVETIQIAFLTKELALTSDEAQKFWPVYNNYKDELTKARREAKTDEVAFEEKILNVRKAYKVEFKKILGTDQRANEVFVAEKNFREMLRKELQERKSNKAPSDGS